MSFRLEQDRGLVPKHGALLWPRQKQTAVLLLLDHPSPDVHQPEEKGQL